jgi:hypothetical protein
MWGAGGPGQDNFYRNLGQVPLNENPEDIKGKADPHAVRGSRAEQGEENNYIEIKAPTQKGDRASVPYLKVLPKYKKAAEKALKRSEIPKEHQKRVKDYFDSLNGG